MKNEANGFSLVELLITVVIIGIIAAIAIPAILGSRKKANEGSAVSSMRMLHGAQATYYASYGHGDFAGDVGGGTVAGLTVMHERGLIDNVIGSGIKSGYTFVGGREASSPTSPAQFFFSAIPVNTTFLAGTGIKRFGITTDGAMRSDNIVTSHYLDTADALAAPVVGN